MYVVMGKITYNYIQIAPNPLCHYIQYVLYQTFKLSQLIEIALVTSPHEDL